MSDTPISATIITLNEEHNIIGCIEGLKPICNEIVVLDSNSSDRTRELAEQAGATVYIQNYLGDGLQKAKAAELATNDWILSIDADERPDADLCALIPTLQLEQNSTYAYAIRRKNYIGNHQILASGYYPNYVTRLYNRTKSSYTKVKRHGSITAQKIVRCNAHIIHYPYTDLSSWIARINELSTHDAKAMYSDGVAMKSPGGHALVAFLKKYLLQGGCFQGQDGVTVAVTTAFFNYMKYLKLHELYKNAKDSSE